MSVSFIDGSKSPIPRRCIRVIVSMTAICLWLLHASAAHAASCFGNTAPTVVGGSRSPEIANISPGLPIGTVFQTVTGTAPQVLTANCQRGQSSTQGLGFASDSQAVAVAGMSNVYTFPSSNWNGLGFRLKENGVAVTLHQRRTISGPSSGSSVTPYYYGPATWTVEYLKIGSGLPADSGNPCNLTPNDVAVLVDERIAGATMRACTRYQTLNPTCTVTATNITIPLGTFNINAFPSVGSTSARSANYTINLNCTNNPTVTMRVSGVAVTGYPSLFGLDNGSAGGIAVQLYNNGSLITPEQAYAMSAGASLSLPISANYYRIGNVTPGSANAHMVATFSYN